MPRNTNAPPVSAAWARSVQKWTILVSQSLSKDSRSVPANQLQLDQRLLSDQDLKGYWELQAEEDPEVAKKKALNAGTDRLRSMIDDDKYTFAGLRDAVDNYVVAIHIHQNLSRERGSIYVKAYCNLGFCMRELGCESQKAGKYKSARIYFEAALRILSETIDHLEDKIVSRNGNSISDAERALLALAHTNRGSVHFSLKNDVLALKDYKHVLDEPKAVPERRPQRGRQVGPFDPLDPAALRDVADLYFFWENFKVADHYYDRLVRSLTSDEDYGFTNGEMNRERRHAETRRNYVRRLLAASDGRTPAGSPISMRRRTSSYESLTDTPESPVATRGNGDIKDPTKDYQVKYKFKFAYIIACSYPNAENSFSELPAVEREAKQYEDIFTKRLGFTKVRVLTDNRDLSKGNDYASKESIEKLFGSVIPNDTKDQPEETLVVFILLGHGEPLPPGFAHEGKTSLDKLKSTEDNTNTLSVHYVCADAKKDLKNDSTENFGDMFVDVASLMCKAKRGGHDNRAFGTHLLFILDICFSSNILMQTKDMFQDFGDLGATDKKKRSLQVVSSVRTNQKAIDGLFGEKLFIPYLKRLDAMEDHERAKQTVGDGMWSALSDAYEKLREEDKTKTLPGFPVNHEEFHRDWDENTAETSTRKRVSINITNKKKTE